MTIIGGYGVDYGSWICLDRRRRKAVVDVMFTSTSGRAFQRGVSSRKKILLGTGVVDGWNFNFNTVTPGYGRNCKLKMW